MFPLLKLPLLVFLENLKKSRGKTVSPMKLRSWEKTGESIGTTHICFLTRPLVKRSSSPSNIGFSTGSSHATNTCTLYIRIHENGNRASCGEEDYISHFFVSCPAVYVFWENLSRWCLTHLGFGLAFLTKGEIILGFIDVNGKHRRANLINWLLLTAKFSTARSPSIGKNSVSSVYQYINIWYTFSYDAPRLRHSGTGCPDGVRITSTSHWHGRQN